MCLHVRWVLGGWGELGRGRGVGQEQSRKGREELRSSSGAPKSGRCDVLVNGLCRGRWAVVGALFVVVGKRRTGGISRRARGAGGGGG